MSSNEPWDFTVAEEQAHNTILEGYNGEDDAPSALEVGIYQMGIQLGRIANAMEKRNEILEEETE